MLHVAWRRFTEAKVVIFSQRLVSHAKPHQQDKNKRLKSSTHSSTAAASTQSYSYNSSSNYVASVQQEMWSFYHMWSLYCQSICLWHSFQHHKPHIGSHFFQSCCLATLLAPLLRNRRRRCGAARQAATNKWRIISIWNGSHFSLGMLNRSSYLKMTVKKESGHFDWFLFFCAFILHK